MISIIVPVYNVEAYLRNTIQSIINQTYTDFELILINDGSIDNSGKICDEYKSIDSRIKVKHILNAGVSNARNIGLELSEGEKIIFIDSDDTIEKDMLYILNENSEHFDLLICGYNSINILNGKVEKIYDNKNVFNKNTFLLNINNIIEKKILNSPCNKIYNRKIVEDNSIRFDKDINMGEDLMFNLAYIDNCDNIICIEECLYNYYIYGENSLSTRYTEEFFANQTLLLKNIISYLIKNNCYTEINRKYIEKVYILTVANCIGMLFHKSSMLDTELKVLEIKKITQDEFYREICENNIKNMSMQDKLIYRCTLSESCKILELVFRIKNNIKNNFKTVFKIIKNINKK